MAGNPAFFAALSAAAMAVPVWAAQPVGGEADIRHFSWSRSVRAGAVVPVYADGTFNRERYEALVRVVEDINRSAPFQGGSGIRLSVTRDRSQAAKGIAMTHAGSCKGLGAYTFLGCTTDFATRGGFVDEREHTVLRLAHDLVIMNSRVPFYTGADPSVPRGRYDYHSTAKHELLHAVGLMHNPADRRSVMFPSLDNGTARRSLGPRDLGDLRHYYNVKEALVARRGASLSGASEGGTEGLVAGAGGGGAGGGLGGRLAKAGKDGPREEMNDAVAGKPERKEGRPEGPALAVQGNGFEAWNSADNREFGHGRAEPPARLPERTARADPRRTPNPTRLRQMRSLSRP